MRLDEDYHFAQIQRFRQGDFRILDDVITTIPGYHLLIAAFMRLLNADSFAVARLISSIFGLLAVVAFHNLRRDAVGRVDFLATAQFAVLPIFLLFVFMVQTDALSLALMLWAAWAAGRQRHWLAGFALTAAICVRQNNVLWLVLLAWPVLKELPALRSRRQWATWVLSLLPYAIAGALFVVYWVWNGSVSLSHVQASIHPDFSIHSGNPFYLMFVGAILFSFSCASEWSRYIADLRQRPWLLALPLSLVIVFVSTFVVDNPYNLYEPPDLRDWLLMRTRDSMAWYCGFGAVAVFGGVGLLRQRLLVDSRIIFWGVSAAFLALSWLIEQRYYLIPFALFMAWRTPQSPTIERATFALWAPLAVLLFWGMMTGQLYI